LSRGFFYLFFNARLVANAGNKHFTGQTNIPAG
jgi:hypothetical protein